MVHVRTNGMQERCSAALIRIFTLLMIQDNNKTGIQPLLLPTISANVKGWFKKIHIICKIWP